MEHFIQAVENSALNTFIDSEPWLWPILEILHFLGLSILIGSLLVVDLRLAGFFRAANITATHRLLPWSVGGFVINLTSGLLFFAGDPARYAANVGFQWKMALVLFAGLNALWFWWKIDPKIKTWPPHGPAPAHAQCIAWLSLATWFTVLLLGRLLPYIGTG
ncbi:MAG: hypothetical protein WD005_05870 [Haliea sp.]